MSVSRVTKKQGASVCWDRCRIDKDQNLHGLPHLFLVALDSRDAVRELNVDEILVTNDTD